MLLVPLRQWLCDRCHEVIAKPDDGALYWHSDDFDGGDHLNRDFQILHIPRASPLREKREWGCYPEMNALDVHLSHMVGSKGLDQLLGLVDRGRFLDPSGDYFNKVKDLRVWVEIVRRLQIPYYEQARKYFAQARDEEVLVVEGQQYFDEDWLMRLIERYAGEEFEPSAHEAAARRRRGELD